MTGLCLFVCLTVHGQSFKREQYPLKLSFSMTIHKGQGQTLSAVIVDCENITRPGQLAVACGRVRSAGNLQLQNCNARLHVIPQPACLKEFVSALNIGTLADDNTCCRSSLTVSDHHAQSPVQNLPPVVLRSCVVKVDLISDGEVDQLGIDYSALLSNVKCKSSFTDLQVAINSVVDGLSTNSDWKVAAFVKDQAKVVLKLFKDCVKVGQKKVTQAMLTGFYTNLHAYLCSQEYNVCVRNLSSDTAVASEKAHRHVAYSLLTLVKERVLEFHSSKSVTGDESAVSDSNPRMLESDELSAAQNGKVRYMAGYVVAKIRYNLNQRLQVLSTSPDKPKRILASECKKKLKLLSVMVLSQTQAIATTSMPDTLTTTERKQNIRGSLVHVTDEVFEFFKKLCHDCLEQQTRNTLDKQGKLFHEFIVEALKTSESLQTMWIGVFGGLNKSEDMMSLFDSCVQLFAKSMTKQFREDYLHAASKQQRPSLRCILKSRSLNTIEDQPRQSKAKRKVATGKENPGRPRSKRGKSEPSNIMDICPECQRKEVDGEDEQWIECSECKRWLHRMCAEILDDSEWDLLMLPDQVFTCHRC